MPQDEISIGGAGRNDVEEGSGAEVLRIPQKPGFLAKFSEITAVKCLTKLSIRHFSLRCLPSEISSLKKLVELDLSYNELNKLPSAISALTSLKLLRVSHNKLVDLPVGFFNLSQLVNLDLSNNKLISLAPLNFNSMPALRYVNIQYNKLLECPEIPSRICCNLQGSTSDHVNDADFTIIEADICDMAIHRFNVATFNRRNYVSQAKVWKQRDSFQERARQERLNYSRNLRGYDSEEKEMTLDKDFGMKELLLEENGDEELQVYDSKGKPSDHLVDKSPFSGSKPKNVEDFNFEVLDLAEDSIQSSNNNSVSSISSDCAYDVSCVTSESVDHGKFFEEDGEVESSSQKLYRATICSEVSEVSPIKELKCSKNVKRQSNGDLVNPKPAKYRKPSDNSSVVSCKYSTDSFCSVNDHLSDGFYDAGRDRPFMSLQSYEANSCLDSREVILLDRGRDEELEAIVLSARLILSRLERASSSTDNSQCLVSDFQRASILALFVSDCFGGSDRSHSITRMRRAVFGSRKKQPFICTCSATNNCESKEPFQQTCNLAGCFSFADLCENSLRAIREIRNSNVVPLGSVRFGVCRHRAVLMKYLCDRMDPPIPCELVRGYLDFMPHAWNVILVKQSDSWVRMVVDACCPADIREETDAEYFCQYIPLSRVLVPLLTETSTLFDCSFPYLLLFPLEVGEAPEHCVRRCKFGTLDAAAKIKNLDSHEVSNEIIKIFEYSFLGEVRMLSALRHHSCIVEIYGHKLSYEWAMTPDGNKKCRLLQSTIVMEYVKGGSLKSYLKMLSRQGERHAPLATVISIARDVACALVEVHSKHIIHRDIKSENILMDLDSKKVDGSPRVKLSDFDRAVPLESFLHTCCIAHLGIHPPNTCVGTPCWMAPEVVQAMNGRSFYGLEVDIWSYGCLLLELLTLRNPYEGLPQGEIYGLLQMGQRPRLTPELEELALSSKPTTLNSVSAATYSDTELKRLRLLVNLFHQCTLSDPTKRPTALRIYDMLADILPPPNAS